MSNLRYIHICMDRCMASIVSLHSAEEEKELFHVTLYLWTSVSPQHLYHHLQQRPV